MQKTRNCRLRKADLCMQEAALAQAASLQAALLQCDAEAAAQVAAESAQPCSG